MFAPVHSIAFDRRLSRRVIASMDDEGLATALERYDSKIRNGAADEKIIGRILAERVARLRMLRHEAVKVRGWPENDPRIRWTDQVIKEIFLAAVNIMPGID